MTTSIDEQITQRLTKWRHQRELAQEAEELGKTQRPMISISRGSGSVGRTVAEAVAQQLNFDLYDKTIIDEVAKSAHVRRKIVESVGIHHQQRIVAWIDNKIDEGYFTSNDYLHHLCKVVLTIGQHGSAVILGRGAQYILNPESTLRVRVIAPLSQRVENYARSNNLSDTETLNEIRRIDAERNAYVRWHFNRDVGNPEDYDAVFNMAHLSTDLCSDAICRLFNQRFG